jgi:hypothetical protein
MSPELQMAIDNGKQLGRLALYFGCWASPGHYLHDTHGSRLHGSLPVDLPWDEEIMDARLLKNRKVPDIPTGSVEWVCGGSKAFWYAFVWWDRSVDKRGACNSGFYIRGFGWPEAQQAFDYACLQFPHVVNRQVHPLFLGESIK